MHAFVLMLPFQTRATVNSFSAILYAQSKPVSSSSDLTIQLKICGILPKAVKLAQNEFTIENGSQLRESVQFKPIRATQREEESGSHFTTD
jgi:hypothetical protein